MGRKPKFQIGDTVYNTVEKRGSYGPSVCRPFERLAVEEIRRDGAGFSYAAGFDGYCFKESELLSPDEYAERIRKGV